MKKFNRIIAGVMAVYLVAVIAICCFVTGREKSLNKEYKVEINRVMYSMETAGGFFASDFTGMKYLTSAEFLSAGDAQDPAKVKAFYRDKGKQEGWLEKSSNYEVCPLIINEKLEGYVRFDYRYVSSDGNTGMMLILFFIIFGAALLALLLYSRNEIMKPFTRLSEMPYELSKGHLAGEIEESKNRYFGRFTWGISMLRDTLDSSRKKELKLEKEKKMLLLSISHDIKTPLNTIKLYAKALEEGVYDTEEKRRNAASHIKEHTVEIEDFVKEIVKSSSEDILSIEVHNSEFYLEDFVELIEKNYSPKCKLKMINFELGSYENKFLKGDMDRAFEVVENLMENAFKYGDGGRITIDFYEEEYCQLIRIFNTGMPVKKEEQIHLFDSFYRGSNTSGKEGSGLGLYICKEIMKKMDGDIFAESNEDGMAFVMVFGE